MISPLLRNLSWILSSPLTSSLRSLLHTCMKLLELSRVIFGNSKHTVRSGMVGWMQRRANLWRREGTSTRHRQVPFILECVFLHIPVQYVSSLYLSFSYLTYSEVYSMHITFDPYSLYNISLPSHISYLLYTF